MEKQRLRDIARELARGDFYEIDMFKLVRDVILLGNRGPAPKHKDAQTEFGICAEQESMLAEKLLRMVVAGDAAALHGVANMVERLTTFLAGSAQDHAELALISLASRMDTSKMTILELHKKFTSYHVEPKTFRRWLKRFAIPTRKDSPGPKAGR